MKQLVFWLEVWICSLINKGLDTFIFADFKFAGVHSHDTAGPNLYFLLFSYLLNFSQFSMVLERALWERIIDLDRLFHACPAFLGCPAAFPAYFFWQAYFACQAFVAARGINIFDPFLLIEGFGYI